MKRFLLLIPQGSGLTAITVGALVLIGWLFDITLLKSLVGSLNEMKPSTAVCLILAGASLFISQRYPRSKRADRVCWILSLAICTVALASLIQYLAPPLQMSQSTAASLCLISAALIASRSRLGLLLTLAAAFFSALSLLGYLYGIRALYSVGPYQSMALHTGACLFFLCIGILFSERHHGLSRVLVQDSPGSNVARTLLPGAVVVPAGIGVLILFGQRAGWYPQEFGLALFAVSLILAQIFFVVWSASSLTQVDRLRAAAEADTRQRQAELAASEERLQLTLSAVSAATFDFNPITRKLVWSEGFHALFGSRQTADYDGWLSAIHPEDRERTLAEARAGIQAGRRHGVYRIIRDGEVRWIEAKGRCIEKSRYVGLTMDITERKRAEDDLRQYRDIFHFASQAIATSVGSRNPQLQFVNPAYARMHGYTVDEMANLPVADIFPPELCPAVIESVRISNETGHCAFETRHIRKDGTEFPVYLELTAVKDDAGKFLYRIATLTDMSERLRIEDRLREAAKLESIGVLAGGIAHDFNNILTGILGNASLLAESLPPDSEFCETAQMIMRSGERAADLIRQMLAYSGKGRFILTLIDLSAIIRETMALINTVIPRSVELIFDLAPDLASIEADAVQIRQVVMNLIINGAEALGDSAGKVTVSTREKQLDESFIRKLNASFDITPGRYVCLEVADNGAGMDQATLARIFDPFFTTKFTGRGLGLSAVLGIVRGHKGSLQVCTEPGMGAVFQVFFPVAHGKPTPDRRESPAALRGKGTILIVDDEELIRRTAKSVLEHSGFRVLFAEGGRQALEIFRSRSVHIDLVLLDMSMPQMSGEETLLHLQEIQPDVRVILSSGFSEDEAVQRFAGKGLAGFLQKPYTAAALADAAARFGAALNPVAP
jgi:PAS domain S-box-containing protein